ncbi:MAG: hypothetical protein MJ084_06140 [Saccharofermentans sp.]|nr:hypothetical protein [Saccharofermentans sp.]
MADSFVIRKLKDLKHSIFRVRSNHYIRKLESKPVGSVVKVGFIVQMPEIWHTEKSIYETMCADARFEPWFIIVPSYKFVTGGFEAEVDPFYLNECKNGKKIVTYQDGKWVDIDMDSFDYIFYQRPYEVYLPRHLRSEQVVCHSRVCYVPYATKEIKDPTTFEDDFFRDVYLGFHEYDDIALSLNKTYPSKTHTRYLSIGNTALEKAMKINKECRYSRVLWAPRWSTDPLIGGSHFLDYYKQFGEFSWGSNEFIIRPHPLMWDNFVKEGIVTVEEKEKILAEWNERGFKIDGNTSIYDTFNDIDILISDRSSIIPMFFMTGKPIIYCPFGDDLVDMFKLVISGSYCVNNWDELESTVNMLLRGEDPLKDKRLSILKELNLKYNRSTEAIVEHIYTDSRRYAVREVTEQ